MGHHANLTAQRIKIHLGDVIAIHANGALQWVVEAGEQFQQRAFAGATTANDAHKTAGGNIHIHIQELQRAIAAEAEVDPFVANRPKDWRQGR